MLYYLFPGGWLPALYWRLPLQRRASLRHLRGFASRYLLVSDHQDHPGIERMLVEDGGFRPGPRWFWLAEAATGDRRT